MKIEFEVFASLIPKKMENHPNLYEFWDHSLEKWVKTKVQDKPLMYSISLKC